MNNFVGDYFNNGRFLIPSYRELLLENDSYTVNNLQDKINNLKKQNDEHKKTIKNLQNRLSLSLIHI